MWNLPPRLPPSAGRTSPPPGPRSAPEPARGPPAAWPLGGARRLGGAAGGGEAAARPHLPGAARAAAEEAARPRPRRKEAGRSLRPARGAAAQGASWKWRERGEPAPMALSKGLRLLGRLEASGESSVLLEARGRGDCLLFEAGTVATLGECDRRRRPGFAAGAAAAGPGPGPRPGPLPREDARRRGRLPLPRRRRAPPFPEVTSPGRREGGRGVGVARAGRRVACLNEVTPGTPESASGCGRARRRPAAPPRVCPLRACLAEGLFPESRLRPLGPRAPSEGATGALARPSAWRCFSFALVDETSECLLLCEGRLHSPEGMGRKAPGHGIFVSYEYLAE